MADWLADGVGAALVEADAGVGALAVDASGSDVTVVVEVTSVLALHASGLLVFHTDLTEWAIGVSSTARQTHTVISGLLAGGLLAKLPCQAVSIIEADFDTISIDTTLSQGAGVVRAALREAKVFSTGLVTGTVSV